MKGLSFTPGPWEVIDGRASHQRETHAPQFVVERRDGGYKSVIAFVRIDPAKAHGGTLEGNARLIAAAPELVEALELVLSRIRLLSPAGTLVPADWREAELAAMAAVRKAKGG